MDYLALVRRILLWSASVASPPTIAVFTDDALVSRVRDALEALGYRTASALPAAVADEAALRAFITRQQLDAVIYDAHARTASVCRFQRLYELGIEHDFDVVVAAIYDNPERQGDDSASSQPIGRRMSVEDVVRAASRLVGPAA